MKVNNSVACRAFTLLCNYLVYLDPFSSTPEKTLFVVLLAEQSRNGSLKEPEIQDPDPQFSAKPLIKSLKSDLEQVTNDFWASVPLLVKQGI